MLSYTEWRIEQIVEAVDDAAIAKMVKSVVNKIMDLVYAAVQTAPMATAVTPVIPPKVDWHSLSDETLTELQQLPGYLEKLVEASGMDKALRVQLNTLLTKFAKDLTGATAAGPTVGPADLPAVGVGASAPDDEELPMPSDADEELPKPGDHVSRRYGLLPRDRKSLRSGVRIDDTIAAILSSEDDPSAAAAHIIKDYPRYKRQVMYWMQHNAPSSIELMNKTLAGAGVAI